MDAISIYLKELKNDNSTKEESLELILSARSGNEAAREQLIKNYLLLVVKEARSYMNMGVQLSDLISEGNLGLLTALEKFDTTKGVPFSTYAKIWIKQGIIRNCMHKRRIVRLPENISELMRTNRWNGTAYHEVSIDTPNQEGNTLSDSLPDSGEPTIFSDEDTILLKKKIKKIFSFLKDRDAEIVKACFGIERDEPMEIEEAAELFKLSTTRINQILRNSLKKMRVSYDTLPESNTKVVEIVSAHYGHNETKVDVTDKVVDMYLKNESIKASNRLGKDPCPGQQKKLVIQYIFGRELLTKTFAEGSVVKF